MQQLFKDIYKQLITGDALTPGLTDNNGNTAYVRMWNNQADFLLAGRMELFQMPAFFIEFTTASTLGVMAGEGVQLYDPVVVRIHILHWQLDANGNFIDGGFEQNLDVFDTKDKVYKLLQKFKPSKGSPMNRSSEVQDYNHPGVYHFIQEYLTTWTDELMQEPVGGTQTGPTPLGLTMEISTQPSEDPQGPRTYDIDHVNLCDYVYDIIADSWQYTSIILNGNVNSFNSPSSGYDDDYLVDQLVQMITSIQGVTRPDVSVTSISGGKRITITTEVTCGNLIIHRVLPTVADVTITATQQNCR